MKGFGPETFGELYADDYDATDGVDMDAETRDSVEVLAGLAERSVENRDHVRTGRPERDCEHGR